MEFDYRQPYTEKPTGDLSKWGQRPWQGGVNIIIGFLTELQQKGFNMMFVPQRFHPANEKVTEKGNMVSIVPILKLI